MDVNITEGSGTASGTDTYVVTLSVKISSLKTNGLYIIKFTNANTGASTLNINGLGAKGIKIRSGETVPSGALLSGLPYILIYDGTNFNLIGSSLALPPHNIVGAKLTWVSASTVRVGITGQTSYAKSDTNNFDIVFTGTLDAAITTVGAGGLQTGSSEAPSLWYGVYLIGDTTGVNTPKLLLIPNGTPFSQAGYDVKRRVGWVRNNSGSDFRKFIQTGVAQDRNIFYDSTFSDLSALTNGSATAYTTVSLVNFVPPSSEQPFYKNQFSNVGGTAFDFFTIRPLGSSVALPIYGGIPGVLLSTAQSFRAVMPCSSAQQIEYLVSNANDTLTIGIQGYVDSI